MLYYFFWYLNKMFLVLIILPFLRSIFHVVLSGFIAKVLPFIILPLLGSIFHGLFSGLIGKLLVVGGFTLINFVNSIILVGVCYILPYYPNFFWLCFWYYYYSSFLLKNTIYKIKDIIPFNISQVLYTYIGMLFLSAVAENWFIFSRLIFLFLSCFFICIFHLNFYKFKSNNPIISHIIYTTLFTCGVICAIDIFSWLIHIIKQFIVNMQTNNGGNNVNFSNNNNSGNQNNGGNGNGNKNKTSSVKKTPEERKEAKKRSNQKYNNSTKGKETIKRYEEGRKEARKSRRDIEKKAKTLLKHIE